MKVNQCNRCKAIMENDEEYYPYGFDKTESRCYSPKVLVGDLCPRCYEAFKRFLRVENTYGKD